MDLATTKKKEKSNNDITPECTRPWSEPEIYICIQKVYKNVNLLPVFTAKVLTCYQYLWEEPVVPVDCSLGE